MITTLTHKGTRYISKISRVLYRAQGQHFSAPIRNAIKFMVLTQSSVELNKPPLDKVSHLTRSKSRGGLYFVIQDIFEMSCFLENCIRVFNNLNSKKSNQV